MSMVKKNHLYTNIIEIINYKYFTVWKAFWNEQHKYVRCYSLAGTEMQQVRRFNILELIASSTLPAALHVSDEQQGG
jgi:hypothetical protein